MFRKTIITALIVMVSAGTVLAKVPLDGPSPRHGAGLQRILAEQTGPKHTLRFKAPRPVNLRTAELDRVQRVTTA
ncbi:hypothetical protein [Bosea sp. 124]|uniref:hypothetical protein n=1 Tax=Bosea sp. 124 TaxID=2135642 RepID=UPI000D33A8D7|nr:hypothetical protein [Bosea sp. 124]PTM40776.1 hypothetical protein C8D03_2307 [Bosea sp. 124]